MNAWDLFEALGSIDPNEFADHAPKKLRKTGLRLLLLAATITLLIGTVVAVGLSARVYFSEQTVALEGVCLLDGDKSTTYHAAHVSMEMATVDLCANEAITDSLTAQWQLDPTITQADLLSDDGKRLDLGTIDNAEAFLGIDLLNSPQIEPLVRGVFVTMVICDSTLADTNGNIRPDGLIVYISLRREEDTALDATLVSECGISVYIAMTQSFLQQRSELHLYSHSKEGEFRQSGMLTQDGKSLLLLENTPEAGFQQSGYALWCKNGLGYLAHLKTYPNSYATPLSLLTPILYDIR